MDDDDLRRGKATNHIEFDEATAILAGDALLTLAFETLSSEASELTDRQVRKISQRVSTHAGHTGMVGGQILDILATGKSLNINELEQVHRCKTGALIQAAVICGALCSDHCSHQTLKALEDYAQNVGLAFQVVDDILDVESTTDMLGKRTGADEELGKSTYPALIGLEESKKLAERLYQSAMASLARIGDNTDHLADLAKLVIKRSH
jgi:geranylgeranyl pyrophosphate synthase